MRKVRPGAGREYKGAWLHERAVALREVPYCPGYGKWKGKCGRRTTQVDHKIPLRDGGSRARENLQPYCGRCHRSKTATEDGAFGNKRRRRDRSRTEHEVMVALPAGQNATGANLPLAIAQLEHQLTLGSPHPVIRHEELR